MTSINSVENDRSPLLSSYNPNSQNSSREPSPRPSPNRRVSEGVFRQPVNYLSVNNITSSNSHDSSTQAVVSRYKYYTRLAPHSDSNFIMPDHVVPNVFLISDVVKLPGSQPSWITIFSLWNTMMGTSLLSMPWAINKAGFVCGIVLLVAMAGLMLYTSYRILHSVKGIKIDGEHIEFSDVCRHYLGRWAEMLAFVSSLLTLVGGMIVYWILISNFLYNIVSFIYHNAMGDETVTANSNDPICPSQSNTSGSHINSTHNEKVFNKVWQEQNTVPLMLILILLPLLNFKSPTFFTKFNALGTISVTYLVAFTLKNAITWGIHLDFSDKTSPLYVFEFKSTFPALTGIAALAYFVQNCVLSITSTQRHPENTVRDLIIAYILVAATYLYMGIIFYVSFSLDKNCIEDNFLNNLKDTNVMAFIARIGLFFQMICVFPLLAFILRLQFLKAVFGSIWPSLGHVFGLNVIAIGICVVFAVFLPHIGKIIGFVGAFCGFSYAIMLPSLVYMKMRWTQGSLSIPVIVFHSALIVIGLANFIGQFLLL